MDGVGCSRRSIGTGIQRFWESDISEAQACRVVLAAGHSDELSAPAGGTCSGGASATGWFVGQAYRIISPQPVRGSDPFLQPADPGVEGFRPGDVFAHAADPATGTSLYDRARPFSFDLLLDGRAVRHAYRPAGPFRSERRHARRVAAETDDPAAGGLRHDANPEARPEPAPSAVDDLKAWDGRTRSGSSGVFAALRTGYAQGYQATNPERFKRALFPAWSLEAIKFLYEQRGIVANGRRVDGARTPPTTSNPRPDG